jgi:Bacterial regulatory protein, Fis family
MAPSGEPACTFALHESTNGVRVQKAHRVLGKATKNDSLDSKVLTDSSNGHARRRRHPAPVIMEALRKSGGIIAAAARMLKVSRTTLYNWISDDPKLQACRDECREEMLDVAEENLFTAVKDGDKESVRFILRTLGRSRGYSDRVTVAGETNAPLHVNQTMTHAVDLSGLATAELRELERILVKAEAGALSASAG